VRSAEFGDLNAGKRPDAVSKARDLAISDNANTHA
jgi:hypothetical protein